MLVSSVSRRSTKTLPVPGTFADHEELLRYLVLHQVFDVAGFVELGQARDGF